MCLCIYILYMFLCVDYIYYYIWYLLCGWLHVFFYIIYLCRYVFMHIHVDQVTNQVHELDGITSNPRQCMSPCWQIWGDTFLDYLGPPLEINMEPENHYWGKAQILTNHYIIVGSMLVFRGVGCLENWFCLNMAWPKFFRFVLVSKLAICPIACLERKLIYVGSFLRTWTPPGPTLERKVWCLGKGCHYFHTFAWRACEAFWLSPHSCWKVPTRKLMKIAGACNDPPSI